MSPEDAADTTHTADEEQVRALVVAYAERLDAGDFDGVAALFERGRFVSARGGSTRVGPAAVREMYDAVVRYDDGTPRTKHVLGNVEVACDRAARHATATCSFTVLQAARPGDLHAVLVGRYDDTFTFEDGRWWFSERIVRPELFGDLHAHMRQAGSS